MNSSIYRRLALINIKNNRKAYFPYIFTAVLTVIMYFIMDSLARNGSVGEGSVAEVLMTALNVIIVFAAIFLFYTNSFLIKQRKKEIGMYNILGMGKGHIARMLAIETAVISTASIAAGLVLGIVFSKLIWLLLLNIIHYDVRMEFAVCPETVFYTVALFLAIFAATLVYNLLQIRLASPVELLHGSGVGEREPRTKILLTLFGIAAVGFGYYIALTTESPLEAISAFFVAVVAVILGTYALFTAGSIALLKSLRKNKKFYYKSRHFISVSGMIYRMKQNAVGLANICILSTIVLVLVSCSVSLYFGKEDILRTRYPQDVQLESIGPSEDAGERMEEAAWSVAEEHDVEIVNEKNTLYGACTALEEKEGEFSLSTSGDYSNSDIREVYMIPQDNYNQMTGDRVSLKNDEVILFTTDLDGYGMDKIKIEDKTYRVVKELKDLWTESKSGSRTAEGIYLIFDGTEEIEKWLQYIYDTSDVQEEWKQQMCQMRYNYSFDLKGGKEDRVEMEEDLRDKVAAEMPDVSYDGRELERESFYMLYGGLFFIGIYLGLLFLMATVLIIYYKQISEGYDDRERYQIMQKVGMDRLEVRRSIKSQVLMVFFIPLIVAVIHTSVAFTVVKKLLGLMSFVNVPLYFACTAATIGAFAVLYAVVYGVTAKEYYRIVK